jgi:hypothetical protein
MTLGQQAETLHQREKAVRQLEETLFQQLKALGQLAAMLDQQELMRDT